MTDIERWKSYIRKDKLVRKAFASYLNDNRLTEDEIADVAQIIADFKSSADFGKRQLREVGKNA